MEVEFRSINVVYNHSRHDFKIVIKSDLSDPFSVFRRLVGFCPISDTFMFSTATFKRVSSRDYDRNLSGDL